MRQQESDLISIHSEKALNQNKELDQIIADFAGYAEKARIKANVPGMGISIVVNDRVVFARGFGVKEAGKDEPVDEHTVFQIGSTTKAFTAMLVAMLVDEGRLDWNDKVLDHLPDFQLYEACVTWDFRITDLMSQRSGLPGHAGDRQEELGFDRKHIMYTQRYIEPKAIFRLTYAYQNNLFLIAAALVEKYTGLSWEQNLKRRIINPLGMFSSSADYNGFLKTGNMVHLHQMLNNRAVALPLDWPYLKAMYNYGGAGAMNSSTFDMGQWLRLNLGDGTFNGQRIVSSKNLDFLHTPQTIMSANPTGVNNWFNCLGWWFNTRKPYPVVCHSGGTWGCTSFVLTVPAANIGIAIFINATRTVTPIHLVDELCYRFYDMYFGNPVRNDPDTPKSFITECNNVAALISIACSSQEYLGRYTGIYQNPVYGDIFIRLENRCLIAIAGPGCVVFELEPIEENTFQFNVPWILDRNIVYKVIFSVDRYSRAYQAWFDLFAMVGPGNFNRRDW